VDHLIAARDYAWSTKDTVGGAKLLPRPTQKQLGKPLGLDKSAVSRCINDKTAGLLNRLWRMAVDLNEILRFSDPRQGRSSDD
jgi:hypothetical protein